MSAAETLCSYHRLLLGWSFRTGSTIRVDQAPPPLSRLHARLERPVCDAHARLAITSQGLEHGAEGWLEFLPLRVNDFAESVLCGRAASSGFTQPRRPRLILWLCDVLHVPPAAKTLQQVDAAADDDPNGARGVELIESEAQGRTKKGSGASLTEPLGESRQVLAKRPIVLKPQTQ